MVHKRCVHRPSDSFVSFIGWSNCNVANNGPEQEKTIIKKRLCNLIRLFASKPNRSVQIDILNKNWIKSTYCLLQVDEIGSGAIRTRRQNRLKTKARTNEKRIRNSMRLPVSSYVYKFELLGFGWRHFEIKISSTHRKTLRRKKIFKKIARIGALYFLSPPPSKQTMQIDLTNFKLTKTLFDLTLIRKMKTKVFFSFFNIC